MNEITLLTIDLNDLLQCKVHVIEVTKFFNRHEYLHDIFMLYKHKHQHGYKIKKNLYINYKKLSFQKSIKFYQLLYNFVNKIVNKIVLFLVIIYL